jgi:glycosyltransferase involved in cell wall biosynthesis
MQGIGNSEAKVCVSVVIPTRRRPELVTHAVASVLCQDFESYEVIVVVDGEDRQTREALEAVSDLRVRVIELAVNTGGAEARNAGVRAACGEWVAFLDDDDEWLPHKLSRQIVAARRSEAAWPVVSSRMIVRTPVCDLIRPMRSYDSAKPVSEFLFCRRSPKDGPFAMQTSTLLVRREMMLAVPFRSGLTRHQDWDWVLRAEQASGVKLIVVDEPLVIYHAEDGRESVGREQDWEFSLEWGESMREFFSAKAYSWFLASECVSRAVKSRAGLRVYAGIVRRFLFDGRPSPGSVVMLAFFVGLPQGFREQAQRIMRRWRRSGRVLLSVGRSDEGVAAGMGCSKC